MDRPNWGNDIRSPSPEAFDCRVLSGISSDEKFQPFVAGSQEVAGL